MIGLPVAPASIFAPSVLAQGVASRGVQPQQRGKPSGSPFGARFTDIASQAGLNAPTIYGGIEKKDFIIETVGCGCAFIDYDNDGWKDLYSANGDVDNIKPNARQHDTMFENAGGREFLDVSEQMGKDFLRTGYQRGAAFGDLNNDGFPDVVVTSLNEPPRILMNSADSGNHWLVLDLRGRCSNRDAIGAKVKLTTAAGRVLYNHTAVSVGFISSSSKRVHFGLGSEKQIRSIEIEWPRGAIQQLTNIKPDALVKIEEQCP